MAWVSVSTHCIHDPAATCRPHPACSHHIASLAVRREESVHHPPAVGLDEMSLAIPGASDQVAGHVASLSPWRGDPHPIPTICLSGGFPIDLQNVVRDRIDNGSGGVRS